MSNIHPLALVDPKAELGRDVQVGPFCCVGAGVVLGDGCVLHQHVTLLGPSRFGKGNEFFPNCVLGAAPQDLKYQGGLTQLIVGDHNVFRENVTIHRGTEIDRHSGGVTRIGNHNLLMVGVHIAHDSEVGNHLIMANNVLIAGHVKLEDCVTVGGGVAMHHFVTVGRNAFVGGMTRITHDVPPYMKVQGYDQQVRGLNTEGMRRWNIPESSIAALRSAFRLIYPRRGGRSAARTAEAIREIKANGLIRDEHVAYLVAFLQRKLEIGVFGRSREALRTDVPDDRAAFYQPDSESKSTP